MATKLQICNMALAHLGVGKAILDFAADRTAEAIACRLFYDQAIAETMRDFPWPFAKRIDALTLVEEDPNVEWEYSYRYPTDAHSILRILNEATRVDTRATKVPFTIGSDVDGRLIYTDKVDAYVEYVSDLADITPDTFESRLTSDVQGALILMLASMIAPMVTGGDQFKLGERALNLYAWRIGTARANALNETRRGNDEEVESEFITVRE